MKYGMHIKGGRTVLVPTNGNATTGIDTGVEEESTTWTLVLQSALGVAPPAAVTAQIKYWVGDAAFFLPPVNIAASIRKLLITGNRVTVDFVGAVSGAGPAVVNVGISKGGTIQGPEAGGFWQGTGTAMAAQYGFLANLGKIFAANANVVNFNGFATLYLLLFDTLTAPVANQVPMPGGRSQAMTPGNPGASFDSPFMPLDVTSGGFFASLSSTPAGLTAAAGTAFTFDFFQGIQ